MPSPARPGASCCSAHTTARRVPSAPSELISSWDYDNCSSNATGSIPERDWRLLAALARKREEDKERDRLADQFRRMWLEEKQERELIEAETSEQFKRYINKKRAWERARLETMQHQRNVEQQAKTGELMFCIRRKEQRCADQLALHDDRRMNKIIGKALQEESRAYLAADRRTRQGFAEQCRRRTALVYAQRREHDAGKRRSAKLRDTSQRVAVSNALSTWESQLLRQELAAGEAARRALTAARLALGDSRSSQLSRARETRERRARRLAAYTARLRDVVKSGRL